MQGAVPQGVSCAGAFYMNGHQHPTMNAIALYLGPDVHHRNVTGTNRALDIYGAALDEAARLRMDVFLGLGRGGDLHLLLQFDQPGWKERSERSGQV